MINRKFVKTGLTAAAMVSALALSPMGHAATVAYSTDFESAPTTGTIGDGWQNFVNQFDLLGDYQGGYFYGNNPLAPAGGPQVSAIATGQSGAAQGDQVLSVYSDYDNGFYQTNGNPQAVEALVYQDQLIDGNESGKWYFGFDAKKGNIEGTATAEGFIKVLDVNFAPVANGLIQVITTSISEEWNRYEGVVDYDTIGAGAVRTQFGFQTRTGGYVGSGNFYDNVTWQQTTSVVPIPAAAWLFGSALVGLVGLARRRRS